MFDVLTPSIHRYARHAGGPELKDRTLALKLFAGRGASRTYPLPEELVDLGRRVCGVARPGQVIEAIAEAMVETLAEAAGDSRVDAGLLASMRRSWEESLQVMRPGVSRALTPGASPHPARP